MSVKSDLYFVFLLFIFKSYVEIVMAALTNVDFVLILCFCASNWHIHLLIFGSHLNILQSNTLHRLYYNLCIVLKQPYYVLDFYLKFQTTSDTEISSLLT